jgi:release factor glutamine methyltransferase
LNFFLDSQVSVREALAYGKNKLLNVVDSPLLESELLLADALNKNRSYLYAWPEKLLDSVQKKSYSLFLNKRYQGEPIAYILGSTGFWDVNLNVSPTTLIPRQDTEILVEAVCGLASKKAFSTDSMNVLDLGTGTGAIALALASEYENWHITGVDVILDAVKLAQENALLNNIKTVDFICSNWFDHDWFTQQKNTFQLIVSNPPYIDPSDKHLNEGDVRFEPRSALVSGNKGLADIEIIITHAPSYLASKGWLVIEHGYDQKKSVQTLFLLHGFERVITIKDLSNNDRVTIGMHV